MIVSRGLVLGVIAALLVPAAADAKTFGSKMRGRANVTFGCSQAPILDPITGAPVLAPSGQRTCTYRHGGYIGSNRVTGLVPASGRITRVRVKAGRNPAPLRVTILGASSSVLNGFSCCTAQRHSRTFRPRANRITTVRMNLPVIRRIDRRNGSQVNDIVALSAVGPGTLPIHDEGRHGVFANGSALAIHYHPMTRRGEPRVDGYSIDGTDLLFQWTFRRGR